MGERKDSQLLIAEALMLMAGENSGQELKMKLQLARQQSAEKAKARR